MSRDAVIEARGVNKRFGGVVAARDIDFRVPEGEIRCMIGPNGAGKSTLFAMLCGILPTDSGNISILGRPVVGLPSFRRVRLGVGLTFQTNRVFGALSVRENLAIPEASADPRHREAGQARLELALAAFGLDAEDDTPTAELSHSQRQWLEISMVLTTFPRLLLLDEPTAGMAVEETRRTVRVLQQLNESGLTIVVVEHDMAFVREVAHSVTVLHQGEVFAEGSLDDITANADVRRIYLGKV